jgi:hypothetical protein
MFGSLYFGQIYFAGDVPTGVIPPPPPPPPEREGTGASWEPFNRGIPRSPSFHHRINLLSSEVDRQKIIADARRQYAQEHPAKLQPTRTKPFTAIPTEQPSPSIAVQTSTSGEVAKNICCVIDARFLVKHPELRAQLIQQVNLSAAFTLNRHRSVIVVESDASYANGLSDADIIALLELV